MAGSGAKYATLRRCGLQIDFLKLNAVFAELPSVDSMSRAEDLEGFLQNGYHGRSMYRLVRPIRMASATVIIAVQSAGHTLLKTGWQRTKANPTSKHTRGLCF